MSGEDSDDASVPAGIEDYDDMTVEDCLDALDDATIEEVEAFLEWEREHKDRRTLINPLEERLSSANAPKNNDADDDRQPRDKQTDVTAVSDVETLDTETTDDPFTTDDPSPFAEVATEGPDAQPTQPGAEESTGADSTTGEATAPFGDLGEELEDEDWGTDAGDKRGEPGSEADVSAEDDEPAALDAGTNATQAEENTGATSDGDVRNDNSDVAEDDRPEIDPDAPLGELAEELAREDEADSASEEDPFEEVEVGELEAEEVWEEVVEGDSLDEPAPGAGVGQASEVEDLPEHIVDKHAYCQRCPHFATPPDSTCTHEGTEIVEVVDSDHFRVRNCPIVKDAKFGPDPE